MKLKRQEVCPHCEGTGLKEKIEWTYKRLGFFVPSGMAFGIPELTTIDQVNKELVDWSNQHQLYWIQPRLEIRDPFRNINTMYQVENLHYDGMSNPPIPQTIMFWANQDPTENYIKVGGEKIIIEPFEVIIINNLKILHKRSKVSQVGRWFWKIWNVRLLEE